MIMKKYFIFAAIATAGLFASCSSSDDIAANDAQNPIEDPNAAPRIRLNIGNVVDMSTRGTGTVGGVGTGTNQWAGQHINVFMFTKNAAKETTLNLTNISEDTQNPIYLYNNTDMITPGSAENLIPGMGATANTDDGEAMIEDGTIQYYPLQGNFDFFGYHVDDAATGVVDDQTNAASKWTIPFTINGTQDIMSTKAALRTGEATLVGDDYYSAKAARKMVQPTLTFKHLLTRLQFVIKAGNDAAGGVSGATAAGTYSQAEADTYNAGLTGAVSTSDVDPTTATNYTALTAAAYNEALPGAKHAGDAKPATGGTKDATLAVKVTGIQALSEKTQGDLAVAWTGDLTDDAKISWTATQPDEAARWLTLMERPHAAKKATATAAEAADFTDGATLTAAVTTAEGNVTTAAGNLTTAQEALALLDPSDAGYAAAQEAVTTAQTAKDAADAALTAAQKALADLLALEKATISEVVYNMLTTAGQGKYDLLGAANVNSYLCDLTPTYPNVVETESGAARYPETPIGEAIILSPSTADISMKVNVSQKVKTNWDGTTDDKEQTYPLTINAPDGGFKPNTSYKVILTVYGFERIEVHTVIVPWEEGATIPVGQD